MDEILTLYQDLHDSLGTNEICEEFCERILRIIQDALDEIPSGSRVGIRCADPCAEYLLKALDLSRINVIGVFDLEREGIFCGYPLFLADKLPCMACDYVIFATYTYRESVLRELESFAGKIIDVYDLLDSYGIVLRGPIKFYQAGYPMVLNHFYLEYRKCRHTNSEERALRNFLQTAVEYKDFVMIYKVYMEQGGGAGKYPILIDSWKKAEKLLKHVQDCIQNRGQADIIAFWTDSICSSDLNMMPKFLDKASDGLHFEKTYTNCPWTRPTMQSIFLGCLPIDSFSDEREPIGRKNSTLISYLEGKGYEVRWVSFPTWAIDPDYVIPGINEGMSSSVIWWKGLQSLLCSSHPCLYIFHFFVETHEPMVSPDLEDPDFIGPDIHLWGMRVQERRKKTLAYLEQCLTLYNQLLGQKTQVFFSDHGSSYPNIVNWSEERLRTYCFVLGADIPRMRATEFFSLINFERLIHWILEMEKYPLDVFFSRDVIFQGEDYYAERIVNSAINFIKKGISRNGIAFRGVRTGNCKYVLNALGEEYYYIINEDGTETLTPLEDDALRAELQSKCGTYFVDIRKYDKFKHSRKLYESILQDHPELGKPLWMAEEAEEKS